MEKTGLKSTKVKGRSSELGRNNDSKDPKHDRDFVDIGSQPNNKLYATEDDKEKLELNSSSPKRFGRILTVKNRSINFDSFASVNGEAMNTSLLRIGKAWIENSPAVVFSPSEEILVEKSLPEPNGLLKKPPEVLFGRKRSYLDSEELNENNTCMSHNFLLASHVLCFQRAKQKLRKHRFHRYQRYKERLRTLNIDIPDD